MPAEPDVVATCPKCGSPMGANASCPCGKAPLQVLGDGPVQIPDYPDPIETRKTGDGEPRRRDPLPPEPPKVESKPAPDPVEATPVPKPPIPAPAPEVPAPKADVVVKPPAPAPAPAPAPVIVRPPAPMPTPTPLPGPVVVTPPAKDAGASNWIAWLGVHTERIPVAAICAVLAAGVGVQLTRSSGLVSLAIMLGVFAASIALWAPTTRLLTVGIAVLAASAGMLFISSIGLLGLPVALAAGTSSGRTRLEWLAHALAIACAVALAFGLFVIGGMANLAPGAICIVAVVAVVASHRVAGRFDS